jgi:cell division protein FtsN
MRKHNHDDIDLSQHRGSRLPVVLVIGAALGVAVIAAWVFTPILLSKDKAAMAGLFSKTKPPAPAQDPAPAPTLASAQPAPAAPAAQPEPDKTTTASVPTDDQAAQATGPALASAAATPRPQSRGIQVATAAPNAPVDADTAPAADVTPQDTPAEPLANVPLPRKRPSRLIEASLNIPLPRPRPEIEGDNTAERSTFDLQVERMR